ncbi:hypothetical protein SUGI_0745790 [Cryptomeria japonica]|nr:hypothetical protein SUGI_0745790 [Cryptomeria japonica]
MRGQRLHIKPSLRKEAKKETTIWNVLHRGVLTSFLECINGYDPVISNEFARFWKSKIVSMKEFSFEVSQEVIAMATGLCVGFENP